MSLACINSVRGCDGCGECEYSEADLKYECRLCGKAIVFSDAYDSPMYSPLCLDCLKTLYKL